MKLREAVGALILDGEGSIVAFRRADFPENWQCPEGGVDAGETPREALLRELEEEVGLTPSQFEIAGQTKDFIPYIFPGGPRRGFAGQKKMFFLVRLRVSAEKANFSYSQRPEEIEFTAHRTVTAEELLELVPPFKGELYRAVLEEFGLEKKSLQSQQHS
jgi:putative (di)nucleoside polyphosphate hydrolase